MPPGPLSIQIILPFLKKDKEKRNEEKNAKKEEKEKAKVEERESATNLVFNAEAFKERRDEWSGVSMLQFHYDSFIGMLLQ